MPTRRDKAGKQNIFMKVMMVYKKGERSRNENARKMVQQRGA
jgi:hypothetical protein